MTQWKEFFKQYKKEHPVRQSFHSGRWGFERCGDCVNLNRMVYRTKRAAQLARAREARAAFEEARAA